MRNSVSVLPEPVEPKITACVRMAFSGKPNRRRRVQGRSPIWLSLLIIVVNRRADDHHVTDGIGHMCGTAGAPPGTLLKSLCAALTALLSLSQCACGIACGCVRSHFKPETSDADAWQHTEPDRPGHGPQCANRPVQNIGLVVLHGEHVDGQFAKGQGIKAMMVAAIEHGSAGDTRCQPDEEP